MRTSDVRFDDLPGFPYQPRHVEVDGHRLARIDEGDGHPVVIIHGVPTWSYLWRSVLPPLLSSGHRSSAIDQIRFGRTSTCPSWCSRSAGATGQVARTRASWLGRESHHRA